MKLRRKVGLAVTAGIMLAGTAGGITYASTRQAAPPVTAVWHEWTPLRCANHLAALPCLQGR